MYHPWLHVPADTNISKPVSTLWSNLRRSLKIQCDALPTFFGGLGICQIFSPDVCRRAMIACFECVEPFQSCIPSVCLLDRLQHVVMAAHLIHFDQSLHAEHLFAMASLFRCQSPYKHACIECCTFSRKSSQHGHLPDWLALSCQMSSYMFVHVDSCTYSIVPSSIR